MRNFIKIVLLIAAFALLRGVSDKAFAQRTANGQFFATASYAHGIFPKAGLQSWGVDVGAGQYVLGNAYWEAGVRYVPETEKALVGSLAAYGGYMFRLAASSNRAFNLYGGGRLFMGVNMDSIDTLPVVENADANDVSDTSVSNKVIVKKQFYFLVGVDPRIEAELFVSRHLAFVAYVSAVLRIQRKNAQEYGWDQFATGRAGAGLRYNF